MLGARGAKREGEQVQFVACVRTIIEIRSDSSHNSSYPRLLEFL